MRRKWNKSAINAQSDQKPDTSPGLFQDDNRDNTAMPE